MSSRCGWGLRVVEISNLMEGSGEQTEMISKIDDLPKICLSEKKNGCPYKWIESRSDRDTCATDRKQRLSDFSIESILRTTDSMSRISEGMYDWLRCTRYKPPKLKRTRRPDGVVRRKLGRNPRIPFSSEQVMTLENKFRQNAYLSCGDVASLSAALRLSEIRIKIWFQNRRARERRERETGSNNTSNSDKTGNDPLTTRKYQTLVTSSESAFVPCRPLRTSSFVPTSQSHLFA